MECADECSCDISSQTTPGRRLRIGILGWVVGDSPHWNPDSRSLSGMDLVLSSQQMSDIENKETQQCYAAAATLNKVLSAMLSDASKL